MLRIAESIFVCKIFEMSANTWQNKSKFISGSENEVVCLRLFYTLDSRNYVFDLSIHLYMRAWVHAYGSADQGFLRLACCRIL